jgi:hypothetical protein
MKQEQPIHFTHKAFLPIYPYPFLYSTTKQLTLET